MSQQDRPFWSPPKFWSQSYLKQLQAARAFSSRLPINWTEKTFWEYPKGLLHHGTRVQRRWCEKKKRKGKKKGRKTCNLLKSGRSRKLQSELRRDTLFQYWRLEIKSHEYYPQVQQLNGHNPQEQKWNDPALKKPVRDSRKTPTKSAFSDLLEHEKQTQMAQKCRGFLWSE